MLGFVAPQTREGAITRSARATGKENHQRGISIEKKSPLRASNASRAQKASFGQKGATDSAKEQTTRDQDIRKTIILLELAILITRALQGLTRLSFWVVFLFLIKILGFEGSGASGLFEGVVGCWKEPAGTSCEVLRNTIFPSLEDKDDYQVTFKVAEPNGYYTPKDVLGGTFLVRLRHPAVLVLALFVMLSIDRLLSSLRQFLLAIIDMTSASSLNPALPEDLLEKFRAINPNNSSHN